MPFIPNTDEDRRKMLERIGVSDFASLLKDIPEELKLKSLLDIPEPLSEMDVRKVAQSLSRKNAGQESVVSFMGAGVYDHYIPSTVDKIISRSEYYTAYTPYQPEVSQGTLQVIYEYQSMICELTSMEVSNASMYDGASALAEAALMGRSINGRKEIMVASTIHPRYRSAIKTYLHHLCCLIQIPQENGVADMNFVSDKANDNTCAIVVQQPNFFGCLEDVFEMAKMAHDVGAVLISCVDPISLGVITPPGDYGADIVVGEGQPLGLPSSFGGPFLGIFASKNEHVRKMPGRIGARTTDTDGQEGFVLTLQTREQHIRRERATSNICTNEALCALASCVYLALMGRKGVSDVARLCAEKSHYLAGRMSELDGFHLAYTAPFFKEFVVKCPDRPEKIVASLAKKGFIPGVPLGRFDSSLSDMLVLAVTEKRTRQEMDSLVSLLEEEQ